MPAKPTLAKFNNIVKKLAQSIAKQAKKECKTQWKLAYVDARTPVGGGSHVMKYRIERVDGSIVKTLDPASDQDDFIYELLKMKSELFDPIWYGIKVTAFPDGRFETEYNHDTNCTNDATFYDFDK